MVHQPLSSEISSGFLWIETGPVSHQAANGTPDYIIEEKVGKVYRRIRANRPKTMCFDYLQLKEMFGLYLEEEAITEDTILC